MEKIVMVDMNMFCDPIDCVLFHLAKDAEMLQSFSCASQGDVWEPFLFDATGKKQLKTEHLWETTMIHIKFNLLVMARGK